jgi:hypothetical protein
MRTFLLTLVLALGRPLFGDFTADWNKPVMPFAIAGNIYYVGTNYLASYLVKTPAGAILINPDYEESVPLIKSSVEKLGLQFTDIKIILISHAHDDHAAGCALAKKLSGAKLMVMDADVPVIEQGGVGDFYYKTRWAAAKVDRVLHDMSEVKLGGTTLTAHLTPGHTKGCTTWTMEVMEGGKLLHVAINRPILGAPSQIAASGSDILFQLRVFYGEARTPLWVSDLGRSLPKRSPHCYDSLYPTFRWGEQPGKCLGRRWHSGYAASMPGL